METSGNYYTSRLEFDESEEGGRSNYRNVELVIALLGLYSSQAVGKLIKVVLEFSYLVLTCR